VGRAERPPGATRAGGRTAPPQLEVQGGGDQDSLSGASSGSESGCSSTEPWAERRGSAPTALARASCEGPASGGAGWLCGECGAANPNQSMDCSADALAPPSISAGELPDQPTPRVCARCSARRPSDENAHGAVAAAASTPSATATLAARAAGCFLSATGLSTASGRPRAQAYSATALLTSPASARQRSASGQQVAAPSAHGDRP
jgi:ribosomal protein L40E